MSDDATSPAPGAEPPEAWGQLLATFPPGGRELAAQALRAAAAAEGDYGFLGGLVNMREEPTADGRATLTMDVTPNVLNRYGYVHGGMLFTLADYAMGAAARSLVEEGQSTVTLEAKVNYLSNVREGRLTARCTALHRSSRLIMLETRIHAGDGDELVAIVTGTYYILPREGRAG
jgi:acyl-CoA thioesterase